MTAASMLFCWCKKEVIHKIKRKTMTLRAQGQQQRVALPPDQHAATGEQKKKKKKDLVSPYFLFVLICD
jgi:hypothetical protein